MRYCFPLCLGDRGFRGRGNSYSFSYSFSFYLLFSAIDLRYCFPLLFSGIDLAETNTQIFLSVMVFAWWLEMRFTLILWGFRATLKKFILCVICLLTQSTGFDILLPLSPNRRVPKGRGGNN